MKIIETGFEGLYIIEPQIFNDERGYFFESYNYQKLSEFQLNTKFIQDNESKSEYGVIRGLHYQIEPYAQTKLLRVVQGKIMDVALDLRRNSATFGLYFSIELSSENKRQFYIPKGFAHGFSVLSRETIVNYKCDNYYNKNAERGVNIMDSRLQIDWQIEKSKQIISEKDLLLPEIIDAEFFA
jgi:dTDP-4-dehydrorhamnose 3,5-epimerase